MTKIPHPDVIPGIAYPSKNKILEEVCNHYGIPVVALYKRTRERKISEPRMVVMSLLKYALGWTNEQIGFEFRITTASVVHGRKTVRNLYQTNRSKRQKIDDIIQALIYSEAERVAIVDKVINPHRDNNESQRRNTAKELINS